jgi:hypothetical protein
MLPAWQNLSRFNLCYSRVTRYLELAVSMQLEDTGYMTHAACTSETCSARETCDAEMLEKKHDLGILLIVSACQLHQRQSVLVTVR